MASEYTKEALGELEAKLTAARLSERAYRHYVDTQRSRMLRHAEKLIDLFLKPEYRERERLNSLTNAAEQEFLAYKEQFAIHAGTPLVPIGTRLVEIRPHTQFSSEKILNRGILEVVTANTAHPNNIASYSRADRGEYIIRLLNKDGKPSLRYVRIPSYGNKLPHGWVIDEGAQG